MLSLRRSSAERLREFLAAQSKLDFTYSVVGATAAVPPAGYVVDRTRIKLGEGAKVFAKAKAALGRWEQFHLGWVETWPPDTPIQAGQVVAVIARLFGFWWLNACRIVYVVDEAGPIQQYGFAYGTLPQHAESGEDAVAMNVGREDAATKRVEHDAGCRLQAHPWERAEKLDAPAVAPAPQRVEGELAETRSDESQRCVHFPRSGSSHAERREAAGHRLDALVEESGPVRFPVPPAREASAQ